MVGGVKVQQINLPNSAEIKMAKKKEKQSEYIVYIFFFIMSFHEEMFIPITA